jgi:DNA-binding LacI/PurR family transcriptional regulator
MTRARRQPASIHVARLAGVSQSAVSRTFTPGASVSDDTRRKVIEAADSLGYRPNALARNVLGKPSNLIGVVMGEITNPFYPEVLELLLSELEARGFRVLLKRLGEADNADEAVEDVLRFRVRGAVVTSSVISAAMAERCGRSDVPVVLFNRRIDDPIVSSVCCDNVESARTVANYLLDCGHRHCAFVSGAEAAMTNRDRQKGFLDRLAERGIQNVPILGGENSHRVGHQAAMELLQAPTRPDAIFCASDILAFGVIDALRSSQIRIPQEISVVGFDDVPMAGWPIFDLTTVHQRRDHMVRQAVDALVRRINGTPSPDGVQLVPGELIFRGTTRTTECELA